MSNQGTRDVSGKDIKLVQNLIEQCILLHMNRDEAVNTIWSEAKIDRHFTELVWQKLEEENKDFFEAYSLRLSLKDHINIFNELLRKQVLMMNELQSAGVIALPDPHGPHITYFQQNPECYASEPPLGIESVKQENLDVGMESVKQENLDVTFTSSLPRPYTNGVSHMHGSFHRAANLSTPSGRVDANVLPSQGSDLRMIQGINEGGGAMIKPELNDYASSSQFIFGADAHVLETCQTMGNERVESYNALDSHAQSLASNLDHMPFAPLGSIAPNFSFSNSSANYFRSGLPESNTGSPFLGTDNFVCSHDHGEPQEENRKLDNRSKHLTYKDFGSE